MNLSTPVRKTYCEQKRKPAVVPIGNLPDLTLKQTRLSICTENTKQKSQLEKEARRDTEIPSDFPFFKVPACDVSRLLQWLIFRSDLADLALTPIEQFLCSSELSNLLQRFRLMFYKTTEVI